MPVFWAQILPILVLLIIGFGIGTLAERLHYRHLARREAELSYIPVTDVKTVPTTCRFEPCALVVGEAVIAADYFKTFLAMIRKILGGDLHTYETLMERARREAIVRAKESVRVHTCRGCRRDST